MEADTCTGCGQPLSETTKADAEDGYHSDLPVVCHGCKAVQRRQKDYAEDEFAPALRFTVTRTWRKE